MSESLRQRGLRNWTDAELAEELRFGVRFKDPSGMYEQILCEAVARILERKPAVKTKRKSPEGSTK